MHDGIGCGARAAAEETCERERMTGGWRGAAAVCGERGEEGAASACDGLGGMRVAGVPKKPWGCEELKNTTGFFKKRAKERGPNFLVTGHSRF